MMKLPRFGIRLKFLMAMLVIAVVSFGMIALMAVYFMGQISEYARLSNVSLGNEAVDNSSAALVKQSEQMISQKALDVAGQISIYLKDRPDLSPESFHTDQSLHDIAVQRIGQTGYTFLYEKQTGIMRDSPDPDLINIDILSLESLSPESLTLFRSSLSGQTASGYISWPDADGKPVNQYFYLTPVEGTSYMVGAYLSQAEFTGVSREIREQIDQVARSTNSYLAQKRADMYRAFIFLIVGLLFIVAALAFWLARAITRPITALTYGSKIIADGNFDYRVEVSSRDEIQQLSSQFNNMALALKESYTNLEQKVDVRTSELREINVRLQQEMLQRELAQEALRKSEVKYRHLVEKSNCIILEMDTQGILTFCNRFGQDFFGYSEDELIGHDVVGTIVPVKDDEGRDLKDMMRAILKNPEDYIYNENENVCRDGKKVWVVWLNQPIYDKDGKLNGVFCVGMDHTSLKQAEEEREKLVKEDAAAGERNRLARDLHDAVSQTLFSASLIAEVLPKLWEKNPVEGRKRLAEIRELTRGALAEMRTLLLELRPSALTEAELGGLLRQLGESVTGRTRIPVLVKVEGHNVIPNDIKVALYRIAQEALNNAAKHSGASLVTVNLMYREETVVLNIADNGKGFDPEVILPASLGVGIMRERAKNISAVLELQSKIGSGTQVTVIWPYSRVA
jgi:PAS domain S-box-containing protein